MEAPAEAGKEGAREEGTRTYRILRVSTKSVENLIPSHRVTFSRTGKNIEVGLGPYFSEIHRGQIDGFFEEDAYGTEQLEKLKKKSQNS